jgi:hypothetical protein
MPLILPGNVASATTAVYEVANSCQLHDSHSQYMHKDLGTVSSGTAGTFSCWVKRGKDGAQGAFFSSASDANNKNQFYFTSGSVLEFYGKTGGSQNVYLQTTAIYRDTAAWYHLVLAWDTTQGTAANRVKLYVNGAQYTWDAQTTQPAEDAVLRTNVSGENFKIGAAEGPTNYFDGYMAEVVFIDGTQYAASDFGEFDSDSPTIWKPKDVSGLTFGNNGFYLDFEASANLGNDANGGTDLTEVNTTAVHQCQDSPTNNFCTLTRAYPIGSSIYLTDAHTQFESAAGSSWRIGVGSIAVTTGKYYYEVEINSASANNNYSIGWLSTNNLPAAVWTTYLGEGVIGPAVGLGKGGTLYYSTHSAHTQSDTGWTSYTNGGNIIMCAIDLTNNFMYFGLDGTWMKSGDPESGATGTGGFAFENTAGYDWLPSVGGVEAAGGSTVHMGINFGNGTFGNVSGAPSAVASAGTNASDFGVFEFNVPSGYGAICTKQMNE